MVRIVNMKIWHHGRQKRQILIQIWSCTDFLYVRQCNVELYMAFEKKLYYLVSTCHLELDFPHTFYSMQIEQNVWGISGSGKNRKTGFSWFNGNLFWNPHGIEVRNPLRVKWVIFSHALIGSGRVCEVWNYL